MATDLPDYGSSPDLLRIYFDEISRTPLLTTDEEKALSAKIKRGNKAARDRMIRANLRLVVKIAKGYAGNGLPLLDLISEGNIGLMKAVERYDPAYGTKFSSYAAWWIKQRIKLALSDKSRTVRLPYHITDILTKVREIERVRFAEGHEAKDEDIAQSLHLPADYVRDLRKLNKPNVSMDEPIEDTDRTFADILCNPNDLSPHQGMSIDEAKASLQDAIQELSTRERTVIIMRFGLSGFDKHTLEEVGKRLRLTRERVHQIQNEAVHHLRHLMRRAHAI